MNKIRKGDNVIIVTGKDKGKSGIVTEVALDKVFVAGINLVKKHTRPNPALGVQGGVVDKVMPIHISNVALVGDDGKPSRVFIKTDGGVKVRVLKTTGSQLAV
ncbi:MAG: 50S ribosomal protein L24 [Ottowia sp.]|nr:50S ribosomal protein L24 [Ottowia sp.]